MIEFRDVKESDFPLVCNFFNSKKDLQYSFPKADFPFDIEQMISLTSTRSNSTVMTKNSSIIGFANLYDIVKNEECYIGNFVIDKIFRKKGFSKILLQEIIDIAIKSYEIKKIKLICWCENTDALILYKKFDFNPVEITIREFNAKQVPVLLLEKIIKQTF